MEDLGVSNLFIEDAMDHGYGTNLFKDMVILDVKRDFATMQVGYVARHQDFAPVAEGNEIPYYRAEFDLVSPYLKWV